MVARPEVMADEARWRRNRLVTKLVPVEGLLTDNLTATPLDTYRNYRFITARQFDDGNRLRDLHRASGQEPRVIGRCGPRGDRSHKSERQKARESRAWARLAKMYNRLVPKHATPKIKQEGMMLQSCLANVCCYGQAAEMWAMSQGHEPHLGLVLLKEALDALFENRPKKAGKARKT